ncbi:aspartate aminotransferase family protein [Mycobacterium dioxanotrophicus]|jgi:glutamate/tyrosine decarboxylase-like PLP-dependent enzyme|uniref:Aspartate aminotransferase family protein n=1 Tax=Mycobacterium dioxanotrophicus TaxID=482462 RepID=A0A1Y0CEF9_9MYCO|nr:pyridoxal-dependent decarboxylase [Mycobacterium dioxanotrophicus]ART73660.1 aspartate aminotransferase family protein [Mycobacterium dioxanotrophicus]
MHSVDDTTEQTVRSVLAYAENRLRMNPVPLDKGSLSAEELYRRLEGLIRETPRHPDEVLGVYSSVIAPSIISADSPRFLGFIPAAPTKASLLFDMLVSCASIQGISWLEASGAIAAENTVLRLIADEAGLPSTAGGCFVSGGSAGNLSALATARETAKSNGATGRLSVVVGTDAHSSIVNTLNLLEMDALVVDTPEHRLTAETVRAAVPADTANIAAVVCTSGTTNAGIIDDLAGVGALAKERGWWFHVDGAYGGSGIFARSLRSKYDGIEQADSFILDPHKWLFTPFDCCALLYRNPELARATHTQDASYLDVIHTSDGEWNPTDYAYHLTRRARGLPLWFSLAVNGVEAYREAIEVAAELARQTAVLINSESHLQLIREPDLGVVLFRRLGWQGEDYDAWAQKLHDDEIAFIPPTKWEGETVGRFAFLHPDTSMDLVREVLERTR